MEPLSAPRGLIVELITPLTEKGLIHRSSLERCLSRVVKFAQGIFLASPIGGEGLQLDLKARQEILAQALEVTRGKLPLMIWITGKDEEETRRILFGLHSSVENKEEKDSIFWVDAPLMYHSNRGLPSLYKEYGSITDLPFILLNDPGLIEHSKRPFKRKNIRTAVLKELTYLPSVVGLIFVGELDRAHNYQKAARGRSRFRIYDGDEARFLDYPSLSGVVSVGANLLPQQWHEVTSSSLHLSGRGQDYPDSLRQIWFMGQQLHRLREIYLQAPPFFIKAALKKLDVIESAFSLEQPHHPKGLDQLMELLREYHDGGA